VDHRSIAVRQAGKEDKFMAEPSPTQISLKPSLADRFNVKKLEGGLTRATFGPSDQGLRLGRAFASIRDPAIRQAIVDLVEAMSKAPQ